MVIDAAPRQLRAKLAELLIEAAAEPAARHRLDLPASSSPGGAPATDSRVGPPPTANFGPVPEQVPGLVADAYAEFGLVGLAAAGDWDNGSAAEVWACARGWADLERNVPLGPGHRFPVGAITKLVTSTAVLCLVAEGAVALDDPVNEHLRTLRLADDAVTVRELLVARGRGRQPAVAVAVGRLGGGRRRGARAGRRLLRSAGRVRLQQRRLRGARAAHHGPHRNLVRAGGDPARP